MHIEQQADGLSAASVAPIVVKRPEISAGAAASGASQLRDGGTVAGRRRQRRDEHGGS